MILRRSILVRLLALLCLLLALQGCASRQVLLQTDGLPRHAELTDVSFHPQDAYQCGPAALATLLDYQGIHLSPERLKQRVYLPGREGSLQVEMIAAIREQQLLAYPLEPRLEEIFRQVAQGQPVLVLQNLAAPLLKRWHYAVVVGYDLDKRQLYLRSGTQQRLAMGFDSFDLSWRSGQRWARVALPSGDIPTGAKPLPWLKAASELEDTGLVEAAHRAYLAASQRWPQEADAWFALGNTYYKRRQLAESAQALKKAVALRPDFSAARANLEHVERQLDNH